MEDAIAKTQPPLRNVIPIGFPSTVADVKEVHGFHGTPCKGKLYWKSGHGWEKIAHTTCDLCLNQTSLPISYITPEQSALLSTLFCAHHYYLDLLKLHPPTSRLLTSDVSNGLPEFLWTIKLSITKSSASESLCLNNTLIFHCPWPLLVCSDHLVCSSQNCSANGPNFNWTVIRQGGGHYLLLWE